ncbi:MAG TPA: hypothetical protein DCE41_19265 [Cytophagales bacterium]|nr:hypothetical protein [Cytophagales bacterium]HAA18075.1 hypothetical protein [Cytophagales bacterium]HAP62468.1 hypothetical protein [Cytophagales bacterium]
MEILRIATDWAKAEVFSSKFFLLFGGMFILASIGFWRLGQTEVAKSFVYPTLVAGILLLAVGFGIFFTNQARATSFATAYESDSAAFIDSEINRSEQSMKEYRNIVFKVIPCIIIVAALLIIFIDKPIWRAISITTIAMMTCILLVDSNANRRVEAYNEQLLMAKEQGG